MLMRAVVAKLNRNQQEGFASIVIALVLILVLSLITVGFAQLMQREQRSALDKQLSNQAFYAAETGLNDAAKALNAGYDLGKKTCTPLSQADATASSLTTLEKQGATYLTDSVVEGSSSHTATGSSYSCLLIDVAPLSLEYGQLPGNNGGSSTGSSTAVEITGVNASDEKTTTLIDTLVISWNEHNPSGPTFASDPSHSFGRGDPSFGDTWPATTGVLRIALTPLVSGGLSRDYFTQNTLNAFLYPNRGGACQAQSCLSASSPQFTDYTGLASGGVFDGNCNLLSHPHYCNVAIAKLGQANFLLDMRSIYHDADVIVTAYDIHGTQLRIKNGQTLVDSTGKAQDVVRRVQAHIPSHNNYTHPDYSLESIDSICKQLQLTPSTTGIANRAPCP